VRAVRAFCVVVIVCVAGGCKTPDKKEESKPGQLTRDQAQDVSFQAFVSRLRQAVARRDAQTIASMMTPNFGYQLDPPLEGPGVFEYWDKNALWPELELLLSEPFVPLERYMVAPAQFATDPNYSGFRAGIIQTRGSWKFAYFVKG
jgi:hypothetical protein